jgi:hypothetical protein
VSGWRWAACGAITLVGGCYRYTPLVEGGSATGVEVRLSLGSNVSPELYRVLGDRTVAVEGRVTNASDSALTVSISGTRKADDVKTVAWTGEPVHIPRAAIAGVQRRTLDKKRTFGIAGLAVLGAAGIKLLVDGFGSKSGGDDNGGGGPPPPP